MLSALSKIASTPESFLWTFPECPVRIHLTLDLVDRLQKQVLAVAPSDREAGGLLLGNVVSAEGDIEVSDFAPVAAQSESKNFIFPPSSVTEACGRSAGLQIIGFYRTHLDRRIDLRTEDLEYIGTSFCDPSNVFLIIRLHEGRASAGFFFWNDGSVVGGLTFPFSAKELRNPAWTTLVGGAAQRRLPSVLVRARDRALRMGTAGRIGFIVLLVIFIAVAGAVQLYRAKADSPRNFGLRIERSLVGVIVAWNPSIPEIASAKDANLIMVDGASPAVVEQLTPAQLHAGRAFFPSVSGTVEARLNIVGRFGLTATDSAVSVTRPSELASTDQPVTASVPPPVIEKPVAVENPITPAPEPEPPIFEEPRTTLTPAVPIHQVRPDIRSELKPLIETDNAVEVRVSIDASGSVTAANLHSTRGPVAELLSVSALNAARGWRFRPARRNGEPVESQMVLEFVFPTSKR